MSESNNPQYEEIKKLLEEKEQLVSEGKYLEAEEIKKKIAEMKKDTSTQK